MPTSVAQLEQWLLEPEGQRLEFKEAKQRYDFEKLLKYCVALANEGGGTMVLGVTDKRPRRIVGSLAFDAPERTEAGLHQRLGHRIPVEELRLPEGRVVIVHVPARLPGTAWEIDGQYFKRAGDDLAALSSQELRDIFAETGPDFSAQPCPGATLADLDSESIALFRERWARKSGDIRRHDLSDQQTLRDAELLVDGDRVSYAALILFGTRAGLTRWLAQAELVFEYRSSEAAGPAADREEYRAGFFAWQDALWKKINLRNDRQSYQDDFFRMDLPTFAEVPVREAILNAVAHRDYRLGGSIFIRQFAKRLEVVSPGGLPPGITPENIIDQQYPRNRRLAEALGRCGLIERSGQGLNLMMESAVRQGKPLPSFAGTATHEVRLTLEGGVRNPAFVRFMERLGEETLRGFSTLDYLALERLEQGRSLTPEIQERLPALAEVGAVEMMGRGKTAKYMLAAALYATLGNKGTYTRKRGLDHGTNKALLLQHLKDQGEAGAPLSEFRQVLPSLPMKAVQKLLDELRNEGLIGVVGQRRWARWYLADTSVFKPTGDKKVKAAL
ncbi:putative DNA binding domain-containing protein [Acidovorax sp. SUPP3434]|uniref:ATP-binding protein n=1 Tax=Acidovorax sp. SUPP3434 TaxID=2920880 RepID=UPI0023DE5CFB|nr:ATP-binding protein [Acidovorax sp. SUPP3434]GKT02402.1 putative DNA binding domain-containing protein [Acidovorax sp. SUPP3434]